MLWLKLNTNDLKLITSAIVATFLAVPYLKGKVHTKHAVASKTAEGGKAC